MSDFVICLNAVFPLFIIMAAGYAAKRTGLVNAGEVPRLSAIVFNVFFPVMLFYQIYSSDIDTVIRPRYILFILSTLAAVYAFGFVWVSLTEKNTLKKGVKIQGIYRNNTAAVGLAVMQNLFGDEIGPYMVGVAILVPLMNMLAVITLELFNGRRPDLKELIRRIITNPLIIASVTGILFLLAGIKLPVFLLSGIKMMSNVATPLILFTLGAFFTFGGMKDYTRDLIEINFLKMIFCPALTLLAAYLCGFRGVEYAGILSMFGSSNAVSSFAMTQQIGGDDRLAAYIVVTTSCLSVLTYFLFLYVSKKLGLF